MILVLMILIMIDIVQVIQINIQIIRSVIIWRLPDGKRIHRLPPELRKDGSGPPSAKTLCFNPRGNKIAIGNSDGTITLWQPDLPLGNPPLTWTPYQDASRGYQDGSLKDLVFNPAGTILAAVWRNSKVKLFDISVDRVQKTLKPSTGFISSRRATSLAFDSTGNFLAVTGWRPTVSLWSVGSEVETPNKVSDILNYPFEIALGAAFLKRSDPYGLHLITAGQKLRLHPLGVEALAATALQQIKKPFDPAECNNYLGSASKEDKSACVNRSLIKTFQELVEIIGAASQKKERITPSKITKATHKLDRDRQETLGLALQIKAKEVLLNDPKNFKGQNFLEGSFILLPGPRNQDVWTKAKQFKAQRSLLKGTALAFAGKEEDALKKLKEANELWPKLVNPEQVNSTIQVMNEITNWQFGAYQSKVFHPGTAINKLRETLSKDAALKKLPLEKLANRLKAQKLVQNRLTKLRQLVARELDKTKRVPSLVDLDAALSQLKQDAAMDNLIDPEQLGQLAERILCHSYINASRELSREGKIKMALQAYHQATLIETALGENIISGNNLNYLCWWGGLYLGQKYFNNKKVNPPQLVENLSKVKQVCDLAVERGPHRESIHDSRGVTLCIWARLQPAADRKAILLDASDAFKYYVKNNPSREKQDERQKWVEAITKDKDHPSNPITKEEIEKLISD